MAIIIGDIHGDVAMARKFLAYKPEAEHVALGDLVDSREPNTTLEQELDCLDLLLESDAVLLWGNHDLAYTPERPWRIFGRSRSLSAEDVHKFASQSQYLSQLYEENDNIQVCEVFQDRYQRARHRFKAAHAVDGWLCTHAGVSTALANNLKGASFDTKNPISFAEWLNVEFERELAIPQDLISGDPQRYGVGPLFQIYTLRGGYDRYGGIFWYDSQWELSYPPDPRVKQIFAHTKVEGPMKKKTWINIHIEGGSRYWVYDTEIDDFVVL